MKRVIVTAHQQAGLGEIPDFQEPVKPGNIRGKTIISLISAGTELNSAFLAREFPKKPGYAAVFQIEETGAEVTNLQAGDVVFGSGGHGEKQDVAATSVVKLPRGVAPEEAVFARMMGVSMSTLNTTKVHAPERVLVTGLGLVGNLAAQVFANCGYFVTAVDPAPARQESARKAGVSDVRSSIAELGELSGQIGLHVECSGHEQAVIEGSLAVRKGGEVVLVGVPWSRHVDTPVFNLLHTIFHRYVTVRSGWEWEIPRQPTPFIGNSIHGNYVAAVDWIAKGRIKVKHLADGYSPTEAQHVYAGLLAQSLPTAGAYFDWRKV